MTITNANKQLQRSVCTLPFEQESLCQHLLQVSRLRFFQVAEEAVGAEIDVVYFPTLSLAGQFSIVEQQRFMREGKLGATSQDNLGSCTTKQTS